MSKRNLASSVFVALTSISFAATADTVADCRRAAQSKDFIRACDQLIGDTRVRAEERALAYRYRGEARMAAGASADAIMDFSEAILLQPTNMLALAGRGRARLIGRDYDGAIEDYSAAIKLAPDTAWLLIERGHVHLVREDTAAAIGDLNAALAREPKNARAFNNRGLAHRRAGNLDQALADYTSAIGINPVYAVAYANRGYAEVARGQRDRAISDLQTALLIDPSLAAATQALKALGVSSPTGQEARGRIEAGLKLVEANCSACHAIGSVGNSPNPRAPEFRSLHRRHPLIALREPLTRGIAAPHEEMPKFTLTERQVDSIVAYINSLAPAIMPER